MAGFSAIAGATKSIERLLTARFAADKPAAPATTKAVMVGTDQFNLKSQTEIKPPVLTLFLVRVEVNRGIRGPRPEEPLRLSLDLHLLITPWAANAADEQRILGSAMRCLEETPILTGALLDTTLEAGWAPNEAVHVVPGDLGPDGIMRVWETLETEYRLSVPYLARVVRLESPPIPAGPPVLTGITGLEVGVAR